MERIPADFGNDGDNLSVQCSRPPHVLFLDETLHEECVANIEHWEKGYGLIVPYEDRTERRL